MDLKHHPLTAVEKQIRIVISVTSAKALHPHALGFRFGKRGWFRIAWESEPQAALRRRCTCLRGVHLSIPAAPGAARTPSLGTVTWSCPGPGRPSALQGSGSPKGAGTGRHLTGRVSVKARGTCPLKICTCFSRTEARPGAQTLPSLRSVLPSGGESGGEPSEGLCWQLPCPIYTVTS